MVKYSSAVVLLTAIYFCAIRVTGESLRQLVKLKPILRHIEVDDEVTNDREEGRIFFGGNGASTATAINNFITGQQQQLEALRPIGGTSTGTGANIYVVNAATGTGGSGTNAGVATGGSNSGSAVANLLIPQVIGAAVGGNRRRRRRRPGNRRYRGRRRPQVQVIRP